MEGVDQRLLADLAHVGVRELVTRDDAEVLQDELEQIGLRQKRVEKQRAEGLSVETLEERSTQRGLAGADVPGDDDEALATTQRVLEQLECAGVGLAAKQEFWSGVRLKGFSVKP